MKKRNLDLYHGRQCLAGSLILPEGTGPFPLVIYAHSYNGNFSLFNLELLAEKGIASYFFDFGGGAIGSRSDGSNLEMSVMTEANEMTAVLRQLRGMSLFDTSRIVLVGHSQGGYVTGITGMRNQNLIKGMVLLSPAYIISTYAQEYFEKGYQPEQFNFIGMQVGKKYFADIKDYDPYAGMKDFKKPVVIVHGDLDGMVPLSYAEKAAQSFPQAKLIVAKGAGHMLEGYTNVIVNEIVKMIGK